ncbi:MAG TPA: ATP-binding protein [Puia sp.]|nr:ATP-binding protein [Puia sp.]
MLKFFMVLVGLCSLLSRPVAAADYTDQEAMAAWEHWKRQPITESNFLAICDLMQDIGKSNIRISYEILSEYVPMVRKTGNREWVHILLMGWARAKEALLSFEDAEALYRQALDNAAGDVRRYDEVMVGMSLMYAEWGKTDSLEKYDSLGKMSAARAGDRENLSFLYTFGAVGRTSGPAGQISDTAMLGRDLEKAMQLAAGLADKNALFTARYNYATIYCQNNPQREVTILESLLELASDPTLTRKPRLYERTDFYFRNATPSIYSQLMQVNLLLADYENASKFGQLLYDAVVAPNPHAPQAPFFNSELAMVKAYQGQYDSARRYLDRARVLFGVPENKIPYPSYFLAAGMVAEAEGLKERALEDYAVAYRMGGMAGIHLMPSDLYYAHGLVLTGHLDEAEKILSRLRPQVSAHTYSAFGYYYYKHYAELEKAKGDYAGYGRALEMWYAIKDSLTSLNHYRAIQEIEAKVRLRDKEQQITRLRLEGEAEERETRWERVFFGAVLGLSVILVVLWVGRIRKQHRIGVMQGAIDAEERERHKIADQLHDEVGGLLSLATLNLSSTLDKGRNDAGSEEKLQKTQDVLFMVATTIRELSHRLTPLAIEKYGFKRALEDLVETINMSGKLAVQLVVVGFGDTDSYAPAFLNDLYRMVQELLHNVVKHAHAAHVLVELVEHDHEVSVVVDDDGIGINKDNAVKGKGLETVRSKIAYLKGRVGIERKKEGGTLIVIELPIVQKV